MSCQWWLLMYVNAIEGLWFWDTFWTWIVEKIIRWHWRYKNALGKKNLDNNCEVTPKKKYHAITTESAQMN